MRTDANGFLFFADSTAFLSQLTFLVSPSKVPLPPLPSGYFFPGRQLFLTFEEPSVLNVLSRASPPTPPPRLVFLEFFSLTSSARSIAQFFFPRTVSSHSVA